MLFSNSLDKSVLSCYNSSMKGGEPTMDKSVVYMEVLEYYLDKGFKWEQAEQMACEETYGGAVCDYHYSDNDDYDDDWGYDDYED